MEYTLGDLKTQSKFQIIVEQIISHIWFKILKLILLEDRNDKLYDNTTKGKIDNT